MRKVPKPTGEDFWVFGYGSLMWRPGFEFTDRRSAKLIGAHRALCVYSFVHRGTPEKPGLVFGLDQGGTCRGIAYRISGSRREETIRYLRDREQVTMVYREEWRTIWLDDDPALTVEALVYMVDRGHEQYAGKLSVARQVHLIRQGHGRSGPNRDYVLDAVKALEDLGYRDTEIHAVASRLKSGSDAVPKGSH